MADCKTGAEHLKSLQDGRTVYLDGELVGDVTTHKAFRNSVRSAAALYDFQARPENIELMTFQPESSNRRVNRGWQMPRSYEEMLKRRKALQAWAKLSCGFMGRSPDHLASSLVGQRMGIDVFRRHSEARAKAFQDYFDYAVKSDLFLTYVIIRRPNAARPGASRKRISSPASSTRIRPESPSAARRCSALPRSWPTRSSSPTCNRSSRARKASPSPAPCR